jgi:hypothetical protein
MKLFLLTAIAGLASSAVASVWIATDVTHTGGGDGLVTSAPNWTGLTQWEVSATPKKLKELGVGGYHLESVSVKPDNSEVVGCYREAGAAVKWVIYNFKLMEAESKVSNPLPPPGWTIVDMVERSEGVSMLVRKESAFKVYLQPTGTNEWKETFAGEGPELGGLQEFPYAATGEVALSAVGNLAFVDIPRAQPKENFSWWEFFGGHGGSELGGYDPVNGIVAVRSKVDGMTTQIVRSAPGKNLPALKVEGAISQIRVIDGITYIAGGGKIRAFAQNGSQICEIPGTRVVGP